MKPILYVLHFHILYSTYILIFFVHVSLYRVEDRGSHERDEGEYREVSEQSRDNQGFCEGRARR